MSAALKPCGHSRAIENPKWVPLETICEIIQGQSPPGSTYNIDSVGLPFFQGKAEFGEFYPTPVKWCTEPTKIARKGDVLISIRAPVGPTNFCPMEACIGRGLAALRPRDGMSSKYVLYAMRSTVAALADKATGTTFAAVSGKQLRSHLVPYLSPSEQERIVAELETQLTRLDASVTALKRVQANLKRYRASVLKAACEGRLVPTEAELARRESRSYKSGAEFLHEILLERRAKWLGRGAYKEPLPVVVDKGDLREGWSWSSLEQLSSLITSGSRGWAEFYSEDGQLFIRAQDINTDVLCHADIARVRAPAGAEGTRSRVENGDLLITITGANVTKTAVAVGLAETAFVSQHVALVKPVSLETFSFVYLWIISPSNGRRILEKWAYGAGKPGLNLEQVRSLPIALPPLAEQRRIVAEVERRLSVIEELEATVAANLKRAERLRQSVLARAFGGSRQ